MIRNEMPAGVDSQGAEALRGTVQAQVSLAASFAVQQYASRPWGTDFSMSEECGVGCRESHSMQTPEDEQGVRKGGQYPEVANPSAFRSPKWSAIEFCMQVESQNESGAVLEGCAMLE
jgi:hypothetical protein